MSRNELHSFHKGTRDKGQVSSVRRLAASAHAALLVIPCGYNTPTLVVDRELVERPRLGWGKDHGEVAVAPRMDSWSAGDPAREGFGQCRVACPGGLLPRPIETEDLKARTRNVSGYLLLGT